MLIRKQDISRKIVAVAPVVLSGILVSMFVLSIIVDQVTWASRIGAIQFGAGSIGIVNYSYPNAGFFLTPFSGKLGSRIQLAFSAMPCRREHLHVTTLVFPLRWLIGLTLTTSVVLNRPIFRRRRPGVCFQCGYDVRGAKRCPECGLKIAIVAGTKHPAWIAPIVKSLVFLLMCAIVPVLIMSTSSIIYYDATDLSVFLREFTVGLIWPEDGGRHWENGGLRITTFAAGSITRRFGLCWPAIYSNKSQLTRVLRIPIWSCAAILISVALGIRTMRRTIERKRIIHQSTPEGQKL